MARMIAAVWSCRRGRGETTDANMARDDGKYLGIIYLASRVGGRRAHVTEKAGAANHRLGQHHDVAAVEPVGDHSSHQQKGNVGSPVDLNAGNLYHPVS